MATTGRDDISPRPYNQDVKEYNRTINTPASNYTGGPNVAALDTSMLNNRPASSYAAAGSDLDTSMIGTNTANTTPTGYLDTSMIGENNPSANGSQQSADVSSMRWTFGTAANGYSKGTENAIAGNVTIKGKSALSMDDNASSSKIKNSKVISSQRVDDLIKLARHSANLYDREDLDLQHRYFRYGVINPYEAVSTGREFLFFTRPDLSILKYQNVAVNAGNLGRPSGTTLRNELANIPFWKELLARYPETIYSLQRSYRDTSQIDEPFNLLLSNMVNSNLEVPSLSAEMIDTPTNMYGVGYSYRGSSEASDDNYEFSLEFKDTMNFPIYMYFKTYEEYETLKHHGVIGPHSYYIQNKILHDHTAIYKFIVGEDMETILYYGKYYGVVPKSLPRDIFSSVSFENGISFSIDFKAAFYRELDPLILAEFNKATLQAWNQSKYRVDVYNEVLMHSDMRPVTAARVVAEAASNSPGGFRYKLKWKGMDVTTKGMKSI